MLFRNFSWIKRAKICIHAISFSLLNLDAKQIIKDKSKIAAIRYLPKDVVTLKRDEGNEIVQLYINDYRTLVEHLLSDKSKF